MNPHLIIGCALLVVSIGCLVRCYVKRDPQLAGWAMVAMLSMVFVLAAAKLTND